MKVVSESYDNRRPIIKRESLRGLFVKGDRMILEVGAGGCIMVTPPAKGSRLDRDMGHVQDIGSGCSVYRSESYMNGEKIGGVTISSLQRGDFGSDHVDFNADKKEPDYVRWTTDVHKRDADGKIVFDVNGNALCVHRAGDIMLDSKGEPIFASREKPVVKSLNNSAPRVVFNGLRDGGLYPRCERKHVEDLRYMSSRDLSELYDKVSTEVRRRIMGGQQVDIEDNPHTVASI